MKVTFIGMPIIGKTDINECWQGERETDLKHYYGNVKWCSHFGSLAVSQKVKHKSTT